MSRLAFMLFLIMCGQLFVISVVLFLISSEWYLCFLGFPTQWVWEQRSHRRCCCESLHLYMLRCGTLLSPSFPLASRSLSQNWLSGTCMTGMYLLAWFPWTKHRCSKQKNEFLVTSFTRTHTRTRADKHRLLHPKATSHDWLGLLVLTPVPVF